MFKRNNYHNSPLDIYWNLQTEDKLSVYLRFPYIPPSAPVMSTNPHAFSFTFCNLPSWLSFIAFVKTSVQYKMKIWAWIRILFWTQYIKKKCTGHLHGTCTKVLYLSWIILSNADAVKLKRSHTSAIWLDYTCSYNW